MQPITVALGLTVTVLALTALLAGPQLAYLAPHTRVLLSQYWPALTAYGALVWHDGQFTYVRSTAQETPALYENRDGEPSLIPYDLQQDGLFIVRRLVGSGWLQIGRDRAGWKIDLDDLD